MASRPARDIATDAPVDASTANKGGRSAGGAKIHPRFRRQRRGFEGEDSLTASVLPRPGASFRGRPELTLADVPPGRKARITAWREASPVRRRQLEAYGLAVGRSVHVILQAAATVVVIEHTELALERDLARTILVETSSGKTRRVSSS